MLTCRCRFSSFAFLAFRIRIYLERPRWRPSLRVVAHRRGCHGSWYDLAALDCRLQTNGVLNARRDDSFGRPGLEATCMGDILSI